MYLQFYYGIYPKPNKLILHMCMTFMSFLIIIRNMLFMLFIVKLGPDETDKWGHYCKAYVTIKLNAICIS